MKINVHIHTQNTDIFQSEKRNFQGEIDIPETKATFIHYGLTKDKSMGRATEYILNCWLNMELEEIDNITGWLYDKIKDKAEKITIGDLRGKSDYCGINKGEMRKILSRSISSSTKIP